MTVPGAAAESATLRLLASITGFPAGHPATAGAAAATSPEGEATGRGEVATLLCPPQAAARTATKRADQAARLVLMGPPTGPLRPRAPDRPSPVTPPAHALPWCAASPPVLPPR